MQKIQLISFCCNFVELRTVGNERITNGGWFDFRFNVSAAEIVTWWKIRWLWSICTSKRRTSNYVSTTFLSKKKSKRIRVHLFISIRLGQDQTVHCYVNHRLKFSMYFCHNVSVIDRIVYFNCWSSKNWERKNIFERVHKSKELI